MDPLRRVLPSSGELPPRTSAGGATGPPLTSLPEGSRTAVDVVARLAENAYLVRSPRGAAVAISADPLPVGGRVDVRVASQGEPALLRAFPASQVAASPADPAALLRAGALLLPEAVAGRGAEAHLALPGAPVQVALAGPAPPPGGAWVVERPAVPIEVEIAAPSPRTDTSPPAWFAAVARELQHFDGALPGPGELLGRLARALRERDASRGDARASDRVDGALAALERKLASSAAIPRSGRELLERALSGGTRLEARVAAALVAGVDPGAVFADDVRALLAIALDGEAQGPVRDAMARALDGLAAHGQLASARHQLGEPPWFAIPILEHDRETTAWMRWRGGRRREDGREEPARAVLAVEFARTGPVRIDAVVARERVLVRVSVSRREVLEALQAAADDVVERLSFAGRPVMFGASLEDAESLRVHPETPPEPGPHGLLDLVG
ncbi:MAG: hypothetical protein R3F34_14750 [Planctomycetota bacterium]